MLLFCFDNNLNCKVEGLILRNSPEMYRRYCKGRPLTFTAGPFSTVCVFLAMPYMPSHVHCFVVDVYGLDQKFDCHGSLISVTDRKQVQRDRDGQPLENHFTAWKSACFHFVSVSLLSGENVKTPPVSAVGPTGATSVWTCESPKMKLQLIVKSELAEMHLVFSPLSSSLFTPSGLKGFCKGNCFSPPDTCCHLLSALSVFVIFSCRFLSSFVLSQLCACSIVPVSTKTRKSQIHSSHLYIPLKMSSQTSRCFCFQFPLMCIAAENMLGSTVNTEQSIICQCTNALF